MSSNNASQFTPNENIQSPELQKFLEKLPLGLIAEAVIGTYGSAPAVLLPEGDYSQYLTGNERVINLGKNVVIVFGNPGDCMFSLGVNCEALLLLIFHITQTYVCL